MNDLMPVDSETNKLPVQVRETLSVDEQFAKSRLIPSHYQGKPHDILIALQTGYELGLSHIVSLNEITPINGRPTISAKLAISLAHQSGIFDGRIDFEQTGVSWEELRVFATAKRKSDGKIVKADASIKMALAEGWTKNTKYKSMPIQMLSYRAALFLIRRYAPEVLLGIPVIDVEAEVIAKSSSKLGELNAAIKDNSPVDSGSLPNV